MTGRLTDGFVMETVNAGTKNGCMKEGQSGRGDLSC